MTTKKGQLRREEIIEEAIGILAGFGVADLSFEAVSKETGLAKPHIQYYFKSKETLLLECFKHIAGIAQKITQQHIETKHAWRSRLDAVAEAAFIWIDRYPDHACTLFLYYHYCAVHPELAKVHEEIRTVGRKRMEEILRAGGIERAKVSGIAFDIQMYITGAILEMAASRSFHDKAFQRRTLNYVDSLLD